MNEDGLAEITVAGSAVPDPLKVLATYMANFSGTLRQYDFGSHGDPDVLTTEEIWKTRIIHSRVTHAEKTELERASTGWACLWVAIPSDANIENADPALDGGLYDDMDKLFRLMTDVPGVSWAKASKILHFKRPSLYPIVIFRSRLHEVSKAVCTAARPVRGNVARGTTSKES